VTIASRDNLVPRDAPCVIYLGALGRFSCAPLAALLAAGLPVRAVVVARGPAPPRAESPARQPGAPGGSLRRLSPAPPASGALPLLDAREEPTILDLAWERAIPVFEAGDLSDPDCLETLASAAPDVICVACFPRILPPEVLALPRFGCLNLHPSLLPAHRGPAPLFWAFRAGETRTGVTVHIMDERVDSGDILLQKSLEIPEGIAGGELEAACSREGAGLMVDAVRSLSRGGLPRRPQNETESSYEPWPTLTDLEVPTMRPARWAYNFIRGAGDWYPLTIVTADRRFRIRRAIAWAPGDELGVPYDLSGDEARVQFSAGVLRVQIAA
jgi:methionyl-tRNA formyltransferase